jgi:hypothetical protein
MAQFHLKIALPDRPGSLGSVASAIGFAGGDIRTFTVSMMLLSLFLELIQQICLTS